MRSIYKKGYVLVNYVKYETHMKTTGDFHMYNK